jgi:cysteine desulfurase/selenocysteine lyase
MLESKIRQDFPILTQQVNGMPLVYLDNAATSQKPGVVIEALSTYYKEYNSNVHRALHALSERATSEYEGARAKISRFIGADSPQNIIFTRNASESLNLVSHSWGNSHLKPGDEILTTPVEHHSNLIPWQQLADRSGAVLRMIPLTPEGYWDLSDADLLFTDCTKLVAVTQVSNVLGIEYPVKEIVRLAKKVGAKVVVDGAQSVPHQPVNVIEIGCDFLAFSGHKMCGPTGTGVLYASEEALGEMEPFLFGGEMIDEVTLYDATWKKPPHKFEAGTPDIGGVIALGRAVDYLSEIGLENICRHDEQLAALCIERLTSEIPEITIYSPKKTRGIVSFNLPKVHPHDLAQVLNHHGVAIRAGQHCAQPLHHWLKVGASARASFYLYNTPEEVDLFIRAIKLAKEFFT